MRSRRRELRWFILLPSISSSIQVTVWLRTGMAAWSADGISKTPQFLWLSACTIRPMLILEANADIRGQSYQPNSFTALLKRSLGTI